MRHSDFAIFILSHGRPDSIHTCRTLERVGYTGQLYIVIDNEDKTADRYYALYGERVIMFDKEAVAKTCDDGDNFPDRRAVVYARNACFEIAEKLGVTYFMQLDDDYTRFEYKIDQSFRYPVGHFVMRSGFDDVLDWLLDYYQSIGAVSIAMAQTGDFIGGRQNKSIYIGKRKCMNSFICSTERPFKFVGKLNEDVCTYVWYQSMGNLFLTIPFLVVGQTKTQSNPGGITELYADIGAYVKPFYSVMYAPSCVKVGVLNSTHARLHHEIDWQKAVPCIVPERYRKARQL